jgi:hypothetical protein
LGEDKGGEEDDEAGEVVGEGVHDCDGLWEL